MNIFQIEERLKKVPNSPLSTRLASLYVNRGRIEEATNICIEAVKEYPKYATVYIILGRCYAALQQYKAAVHCVEKSLALVPNAALPKNLLYNWTQNIHNMPEDDISSIQNLEFLRKLFIESSEQILEEKEELPEIDFENSISTEVNKCTSVENNIIEKSNGDPDENDLGKIVVALSSHTSINKPDNSSIEEKPDKNILLEQMPPIASVTLAEIYSKQGEYEEAIQTYKLLIKYRPKQKENFELKIKELEDKRRLKKE